jgi:hypothetical protein
MTERLQEEAMRRQEDLLREQVELMRERAPQNVQQTGTPRETAGDLISPDNLSLDLLKEALDSAMFETSYDEDGDLLVEDGVRCFVLPGEKRDRIRLLTSGREVQEGVARAEALEAANRINDEYFMVRASVTDRNVLFLDYDVFLKHGIGKRSLAWTVKRFCAIADEAIREHASGVVEE